MFYGNLVDAIRLPRYECMCVCEECVYLQSSALTFECVIMTLINRLAVRATGCAIRLTANSTVTGENIEKKW